MVLMMSKDNKNNKNPPKPSTSRGDLMTRGLSFISDMKYKKRKMAPIRTSSDDLSSLPHASTSSNVIDSVPLCEKIAPTTRKDLIVHPKKIKEVADWLESVFDDGKQASRDLFLILTGPSGSGKTTTLKILAKDYNIEVVEYKDPMYIKDVFVEDIIDENAMGNNRAYSDHVDNQSQIKNIKSFFMETNTFFNKKSQKRLIIVKEIPATLQSNPESYQDVWLNYKKRFRRTGAPIVLMFTTDYLEDKLISRLFPISKGLGPVKIIRFNAMTQNQTTKFLSKKVSRLNPAAIQDIIQGDKCDLRSMVNSVELKFESSTVHDKLTGRPAKKRKTSSTVRGSENGKITDRDQLLDVHHFVAKILYAKRDFHKMPSFRLPSHLKKFERKPLVEDPCRLVENSPIGSERLLLYLYENYTHFCADIHHAPLAMDWLSIADSLRAENPESDSSLEEYRSIIATAGLMFSLCPEKPAQVRQKGRFELKYHTLDRNSSSKMEAVRKDLNLAIYPKKWGDEFTANAIDGGIYNTHGFHTPRNLLLDILPYLSVMKAHSHPELRKKYDERILSHSKFGGIGGSSRELFARRSRMKHSPGFTPSNDIKLVNVVDNEDLGTFIDSDPDDF